MDKSNVLPNGIGPGHPSSYDLRHTLLTMQNQQTGYQHSLQMHPHHLQKSISGMQMQHTPYNQHFPMLVANPLPTTQQIDYTINHQKATALKHS
jgi:hypothetical protein